MWIIALFISYYESIHSPPPSGSSAIGGGKTVYCEKLDFSASEVILYWLWGFFLSLTPVPNGTTITLIYALFFPFTISLKPLLPFILSHSMPPALSPASHSLLLRRSCLFFSLLSDILTNLSGRAVPGAMWQARRLLGGPVSVLGGLDWRRVRPKSVPSSLRGTRPVPRRDLHLSAGLGGRALQYWWAACEHLIIPSDVLIRIIYRFFFKN